VSRGFVGAYLRFALVGVIVAVLTALVLSALVEGAGVDPRLGQALALGALVPLSFLLSKRWAFGEHPEVA
jgi:putative flippase GtrA